MSFVSHEWLPSLLNQYLFRCIERQVCPWKKRKFKIVKFKNNKNWFVKAHVQAHTRKMFNSQLVYETTRIRFFFVYISMSADLVNIKISFAVAIHVEWYIFQESFKRIIQNTLRVVSLWLFKEFPIYFHENRFVRLKTEPSVQIWYSIHCFVFAFLINSQCSNLAVKHRVRKRERAQ